VQHHPDTHALSRSLQTALEDLLGDMTHARRRGDLGRLALLAYWDVRRWGAVAGDRAVVERCAALATGSPHPSREAFLALVDELIAALEDAQLRSRGHVEPARHDG